jgi:two-component system NarL family sensor kinase
MIRKTLLLVKLLLLVTGYVQAQKLQTDTIKKSIKAQIDAGRALADKGENVKALSVYQLALGRAEDSGEENLKAHIFKNIGALYISWKKFDEALGYYEKAQKIASEVKDQELVADCMNNKGTVYEQQLRYKDALVVYKNALEVYTGKNIVAKMSMALSNIAIVYKFLKDYPAAVDYNLKALALSSKTGDEWMMSATYNNIGNLYGEMGDYKKAMEYCNKALSIAEKIHAIEIIESTYDSMADAAAKAGDYKNAFAYHKLFARTNSKFINIESTRQLSELNVKYETEKRQKIIQQQQFQISRRNYWIFGSSLLLVLVLIVGYLIFRNFRYQQQRRLREEIHKQQELANKALFEGEQNERIRIARDLHDSIGQMLSVVKMNVSTLQHQFPDNQTTMGTLDLVDKTIGEVRAISHNLLPEALNFGLFSGLEEMADKINASGSTKVLLEVPEQVRKHQFNKQSELSIYRIVQEVLSNMVKHAEATQINLDVYSTATGLIINIKDNGKGFDPEQIRESKGLGWKNIFARVNLLDGKMQVQSEKLTGTQIEITIPA